MKKMSEVFELPLIVDSDNDIHIGNGDWILINPSAPECVGAHVAHAINHVDALADALEAIVSDYNQYRAVNGIDLTDDHCAKLDVKMATAEAALVAYRGEK